MPTRRTLLQAAAAATPLGNRGVPGLRSAITQSDGDGSPADNSAAITVPVHVHRVPTVSDATRRRVVRAVEVGVEQVCRVADARIDRGVGHAVSVGSTAPRRRIATRSRRAVFDSCRDWLDATNALALDAVHLVLVDAPFEGSIGYGGNRTHLFDGGPVSYANVGATERWDDAVVTANIAVHEVLHALVTPTEVRSVLGRGCEHDLGAVYPAGRGGAIVTPFATAYAEDSYGGETQWSGSGCLGGFSRDVRYDPDWWGHTYALSAATLDATTRYLDRY